MHRCYGDPSIAERFRMPIDISVAGDPAGVFWMAVVTKWHNVKPIAEVKRSEGEN